MAYKAKKYPNAKSGKLAGPAAEHGKKPMPNNHTDTPMSQKKAPTEFQKFFDNMNKTQFKGK